MRTSDALYTHEDSQKKPPETKRTLDELPKATRDKLIQVANDSFPVENSDDDSSDDDSSDGETRAVSKEQKAIAKQKREVAIQNKIKQLLSRLNEPDAVPTTETNTKYISQVYTAVSLSEF